MGRKIMVVDDDLHTVQVLWHILRAKGYPILATTDPEEALRWTGDDVGLIFLDIGMPGIDGVEFCRRLRKSPDTAQIPVLFVTGLPADQAEAATKKAGAREWIPKPLSTPILLEKAARYLGLPENDIQKILKEAKANG